MMMLRSAPLVVATLLALAAPASAREAADWLRDTLSRSLSSGDQCGRREAALKGTLARMRGLSLPSTGKVLVVNIPSGIATAYEDGVPIIESRAVVGKPATPTPRLDTVVTFVRPNPTWTVPESILGRKGWRERLKEDPEFFERNEFDIIVGGRRMAPADASEMSARATFVQRPGKDNALGLLKIGISNSSAIYLHDTNEPENFRDEVRLASSGCVRIESIREIGAWVLGTDTAGIDAMIEDGDVTDHPPASRVRVILGYWTAWPDADGKIRFYPDVYGLDGDGDTCPPGQADGPTAEGTRAIWTEYTTR